MRLERYSGQADEWDDFAQKSRNATIFHLRRFLSYHPPDRFEDHSLLFYDSKNRLVAIFPAADVGGKLVSHPGASFGGLAMAPWAGAETVDFVVGALSEYGSFDAIIMNPSPSLYHARPAEDLDYALTRHGFTVDKLTLSTAVPLDDAGVAMRSDTRRSIQKALHLGIRVTESDFWAGFWDILGDTLRGRHGAEPTHSLAEIETLAGLFPDKIRLFCAYAENAKVGGMVGGMVTFAVTNRVLLAFYYATDYEFQDVRPLNAVIPWVMAWGKERGFQYLDHGISTEGDAAVPNWGLFRFKEGFGLGGVARRRWRKDYSATV